VIWLVADDFEDDEKVYEELEFAMVNHVCPQCGFHLDLVRRKGLSYLRCCNVKCSWECVLFGTFDPFDKHSGEHVFTKGDLVFLRSCASTCLGCEFLYWCDVHKFYCGLGLPLTTVSCSCFAVRLR
jgi:hypothetical protein